MDRRDERGYSLPEVMVSVAIFMTLSAIALALYGTVIADSRADSEVKRLVGMMQLARETAITRQRDVELRIDADTNRVSLIRHDDEDTEVPFMEMVLEGGVRFERFADFGDTPEGFGGDENVVEFGDATQLLFISDGSLVDENDVPRNGAIFLALEGKPHTARAIAVTGATARARSYRWVHDAWAAQ